MMINECDKDKRTNRARAKKKGIKKRVIKQSLNK